MVDDKEKLKKQREEAASARTPYPRIKTLSYESDVSTRYLCLTKHPSVLPVSRKLELLEDESPLIRRTLSRTSVMHGLNDENMNIVFTALTRDTDESVRYYATRNAIETQMVKYPVEKPANRFNDFFKTDIEDYHRISIDHLLHDPAPRIRRLVAWSAPLTPEQCVDMWEETDNRDGSNGVRHALLTRIMRVPSSLTVEQFGLLPNIYLTDLESDDPWVISAQIRTWNQLVPGELPDDLRRTFLNKASKYSLRELVKTNLPSQYWDEIIDRKEKLAVAELLHQPNFYNHPEALKYVQRIIKTTPYRNIAVQAINHVGESVLREWAEGNSDPVFRRNLIVASLHNMFINMEPRNSSAMDYYDYEIVSEFRNTHPNREKTPRLTYNTVYNLLSDEDEKIRAAATKALFGSHPTPNGHFTEEWGESLQSIRNRLRSDKSTLVRKTLAANLGAYTEEAYEYGTEWVKTEKSAVVRDALFNTLHRTGNVWETSKNNWAQTGGLYDSSVVVRRNAAKRSLKSGNVTETLHLLTNKDPEIVKIVAGYVQNNAGTLWDMAQQTCDYASKVHQRNILAGSDETLEETYTQTIKDSHTIMDHLLLWVTDVASKKDQLKLLNQLGAPTTNQWNVPKNTDASGYNEKLSSALASSKHFTVRTRTYKSALTMNPQQMEKGISDKSSIVAKAATERYLKELSGDDYGNPPF